jgi:2-oxoglutarate ferredoxin oxidoreductase subunit gamma
VAGATTLDAAKDAVMKSVPKGTEKMNIQAFTKGYEFGLSLLKGRVRKASGQTGAMP